MEEENICSPCHIAVQGIISHINGLFEKTDALKDMDNTKKNEITIKGFIYTRDQLKSKIERHKRWIKENEDRFYECCKTGILPSPKIVD